jgi:Cu(I)/Ag(I) efflux system membrane protein CusA/SilA
VKKKAAEIAGGLPSKTLEDGTISQVTIVPFYDRSKLINETLGTLEEALSLEILITIIVIILLLLNLKSSFLVAGSLPVAVLICFIAMRYFGVDANIVALSGIAIAIGTMVDMGIVLIESMNIHLEKAPKEQTISTTIYNATREVAPAVITAVATTIVSFLPVFTMEAAEGKLFRPLAFTKTFALLASILVSITILPPLATQIFSLKSKSKWLPLVYNACLFVLSIALLFTSFYFIGIMGLAVSIFSFGNHLLKQKADARTLFYFDIFRNIVYALIISTLLASIWMPLGVEKSVFINLIFVAGTIGSLIGFFYVIIHFYERILRFLLRVKFFFLLLISIILFLGLQIARSTGQEFMPALNEGAFLLMPTSMPHSGMQVNQFNLRALDMAVTAIPEVETVVGKAGRVESALDPAPMSMYENIVLYKSEFALDESGHRIRYQTDKEGLFILTSGESLSNEEAIFQKIDNKLLIPDSNGSYFRQWRSHIKSPDDIWDEIVLATNLPGITSAPKLQPIQTRLVMLQTGMRAPLGIKIKGPDLATIEAIGLEIESHLKLVEGVKIPAVFAERIVGKPYLLLDINREEISRYGLTIVEVQNQIQAAVGGMVMTTTVEGRERYGIKIRYPRELRNDPEKLMDIYISTTSNGQIHLGDVVDIRYEQGPQAIKSEDGFLIGYVLFDKLDNYSEVDVVTNAQNYLDALKANKGLVLPKGVSYKFAGTYEQQVRASDRLSLVVPIALFIILLILYFQFRSITISLIVFTGVFVAFSGGFIIIWFYGQDWFLNFSLFGTNLRDLFQMKVINLSVAVWVGFLALFGIATDDGVLVGTFLKDSFKRNKPNSIEEIRDAVVEGGLRRVKPAMMTTATTILALLPVLTSTGRGSDIMIPMAIPSFGGMTLQIVTMFTVPILFALWKETGFKWEKYKNKGGEL